MSRLRQRRLRSLDLGGEKGFLADVHGKQQRRIRHVHRHAIEPAKPALSLLQEAPKVLKVEPADRAAPVAKRTL